MAPRRTAANKKKPAKGASSSTSIKATQTRSSSSSSSSASRGATVAADEVIPALLQLESAVQQRRRRTLRVTPLYEDLISLIPSFLTPQECTSVRQYAEQEGLQRVTQRATRDYAFRDNDRLLRRLPAFAALLWARLAPLVPSECEGMRATGLNPAIRFYRYNKGQRFGCHVDQSDVDPVTGDHSRYTVLVYLNDPEDSDLMGGETVFYSGNGHPQDQVLAVRPLTGAVLVHGHGDQCLLHEGAEVTRGAKYLLRSDVMYAK